MPFAIVHGRMPPTAGSPADTSCPSIIQVGDTKLYYSFTAADQYYFNLVISNTRVPVAEVAVVIQGKRISLTRSTNNNWAYHNSDGAYEFPMDITITPVCGKAVSLPPAAVLSTHICRWAAWRHSADHSSDRGA